MIAIDDPRPHGLRTGDRVRDVDGRAVDTRTELLRALDDPAPHRVGYERDGRRAEARIDDSSGLASAATVTVRIFR